MITEIKVNITRIAMDGKITCTVALNIPSPRGIFGPEIFERSYEGDYFYSEE